jgi:hypothetical protein
MSGLRNPRSRIAARDAPSLVASETLSREDLNVYYSICVHNSAVAFSDPLVSRHAHKGIERGTEGFSEIVGKLVRPASRLQVCP